MRKVRDYILDKKILVIIGGCFKIEIDPNKVEAKYKRFNKEILDLEVSHSWVSENKVHLYV